jgi:diphthamide biosynthesis protein 4
MPAPTTPPNHYEILGLSFPGSTQQRSLQKQDLKLAYHRALLKNHPDKSSINASFSSNIKTKAVPSSHLRGEGCGRVYTIDEITAAYKTLSNPALRAEYDRSLLLVRPGLDSGDGARNRVTKGGEGDDIFHTGLETVDLEDLDYMEEGSGGEEEGGVWYRGCRCGETKGFLVREGDLEREVEEGEVLVGCRGCSLWLRVLFGVVDGEEEEGDDGDGVCQDGSGASGREDGIS